MNYFAMMPNCYSQAVPTPQLLLAAQTPTVPTANFALSNFTSILSSALRISLTNYAAHCPSQLPTPSLPANSPPAPSV